MDLAQLATDLSTAIDVNHVGTGVVVAAATAEIIQTMKTSGIKALGWIRMDTQQVNRIVGGVVAFLTGLGISFHYDHVTGQLIINGLLTSSITHGVTQWVQQQVYYRLVIAKGTSAPPATP